MSIKELLNYIVIVNHGGEKKKSRNYNTVNKGFLEAGLWSYFTFSILDFS